MKKLTINCAIFVLILIAASFLWYDRLAQDPFPLGNRHPVTVAVIFNGSKNDGGWNEAHYRGFESVRDEMGVRIVYRENVPDMDRSILPVIDDLISHDHAEIIFAPSINYGPYLLEAAERYPEVKFFSIAGAQTRPNLAAYFGRMYQVRYLTGIIAGMQTQTNHIGFVAAFPIPEVIRGINAFTLGVRSVNPDAVVHVQWTGTWNDASKEITATDVLLQKYPIDVIAQHQNAIYPLIAAQRHQVYAIGYNMDHAADFPDVFLTAPVWNWAGFYRDRLQECFEGRFQGRSYMQGIQSGIIGIAPITPLVSSDTVDKVMEARQRIESGQWDVFFGPIYDQQGVMRVKPGENIADQVLISGFDWFVQGVDGDVHPFSRP